MSFRGQAREPAFTCLSPGAEMGNVCNYPWWTMFIRLGTLWECPRCHKRSILEWIEAGGWGMKSWRTYTGQPTRNEKRMRHQLQHSDWDKQFRGLIS